MNVQVNTTNYSPDRLSVQITALTSLMIRKQNQQKRCKDLTPSLFRTHLRDMRYWCAFLVDSLETHYKCQIQWKLPFLAFSGGVMDAIPT